MRYIVQVRREGRWVQVGHPDIDRKKAMEKLEAIIDSGLYDQVRLLDGDNAPEPIEMLL